MIVIGSASTKSNMQQFREMLKQYLVLSFSFICFDGWSELNQLKEV